MPKEVPAFTEEDRAMLNALAAQTEAEPFFMPGQPEELKPNSKGARRRRSRKAAREERPEGVSDEAWAIFQSLSFCGGIQPIREEELLRDAEHGQDKDSEHRKPKKTDSEEKKCSWGGIVVLQPVGDASALSDGDRAAVVNVWDFNCYDGKVQVETVDGEVFVGYVLDVFDKDIIEELYDDDVLVLEREAGGGLVGWYQANIRSIKKL